MPKVCVPHNVMATDILVFPFYPSVLHLKILTNIFFRPIKYQKILAAVLDMCAINLFTLKLSCVPKYFSLIHALLLQVFIVQKVVLSAYHPPESFYRTLDSSVKKNSVFIKKLGTLTEATKDKLVQDLNSLNLTKYIEEVGRRNYYVRW